MDNPRVEPNPAAANPAEQLARALDANVLRHRVIAANIAHAGVPGYQARRLGFAGELELAGTPVALDSEVAALAHNQLQYQVLIKALTRHLALLSNAVNEGKR